MVRSRQLGQALGRLQDAIQDVLALQEVDTDGGGVERIGLTPAERGHTESDVQRSRVRFCKVKNRDEVLKSKQLSEASKGSAGLVKKDKPTQDGLTRGTRSRGNDQRASEEKVQHAAQSKYSNKKGARRAREVKQRETTNQREELKDFMGEKNTAEYYKNYRRKGEGSRAAKPNREEDGKDEISEDGDNKRRISKATEYESVAKKQRESPHRHKNSNSTKLKLEKKGAGEEKKTKRDRGKATVEMKHQHDKTVKKLKSSKPVVGIHTGEEHKSIKDREGKNKLLDTKTEKMAVINSKKNYSGDVKGSRSNLLEYTNLSDEMKILPRGEKPRSNIETKFKRTTRILRWQLAGDEVSPESELTKNPSEDILSAAEKNENRITYSGKEENKKVKRSSADKQVRSGKEKTQRTNDVKLAMKQTTQETNLTTAHSLDSAEQPTGKVDLQDPEGKKDVTGMGDEDGKNKGGKRGVQKSERNTSENKRSATTDRKLVSVEEEEEEDDDEKEDEAGEEEEDVHQVKQNEKNKKVAKGNSPGNTNETVAKGSKPDDTNKTVAKGSGKENVGSSSVRSKAESDVTSVASSIPRDRPRQPSQGDAFSKLLNESFSEYFENKQDRPSWRRSTQSGSICPGVFRTFAEGLQFHFPPPSAAARRSVEMVPDDDMCTVADINPDLFLLRNSGEIDKQYFLYQKSHDLMAVTPLRSSFQAPPVIMLK
ncbi:hypothetical protein RRG08_044534 [Elysia crispata]|uniref:Uncharacterized protein n=1 Tax=Elysia crispata TaxID=231223 RepID=A0AAE0ZDF5_9GAST|nr:hypothetical protein RRG08_044534 [Elysia crispata]